MTAPRLDIRLDLIRHNAKILVDRLARRGIGVTGVTKATLGSPEIARELLGAGVSSLGESRIENIEALRRAGVEAEMVLVRSPMLSQVDRVVAHADLSLNSELDVVAALSSAAADQRRDHGVMLMVELGDLREGILPDDLVEVARRTRELPNIVLRGIGANLACQSGIAPDEENMRLLSTLASSIEATLGCSIEIVSGGNSANLDWSLASADVGRINNLRLGESILLGRETLARRPIDGLHLDAVTLVAEVIEAKVKPNEPWGVVAQAAFGAPPPVTTAVHAARVILAVGRQDIEPDGLVGPPGVEVLGASSDHLVVGTASDVPAIGSEMRFDVDYAALLQAMTSPFVERVFSGGSDGE